MNNKTVNVTCPLDIDAINGWLATHGLHIGPLPAAPAPTQTEAERLVEIATSLPDEAIETWGAMRNLTIDHEDDIRMGTVYYSPDEFSTILLGVMAAYVGTEPNAHVVIGRNRVVIWSSCFDDACHNAPDLLTAYCDCCLAIHARRSGNDK